MKIAFISQYFFPEPFSNNTIVKALTERGHDVDVICCVPNYPAGEFYEGYSNREKRRETWGGARILRAWTVPRGKRAGQLILNYLVYPISSVWQITRHIKTRPDVSFVSMPSPLFQAFVGVALRWMRGTPTVYWVQDIWPDSAILTLKLRNPLIVKPLTWVCGWLYRRADLILVQSAAFPKMIERFGVDPAKIRVFPNTAPDTYLPIASEDAPMEGEFVPKAPFRLMFAGNIGESQDFDCLIDAAHLLKEETRLVWVIIGSGRDLERVKKRIQDEGLEDVFHFLGRHPEEVMPRFFAHADAMLVSLKDEPIFALTVPYKIQCYMACGKPIIGSLSGEGARILEISKSGAAAPASEPDKLVEVIRTMLGQSPKALSSMGDNARAFFEAEYASEIILGRLEGWLEEAAQSRPRKNQQSVQKKL